MNIKYSKLLAILVSVFLLLQGISSYSSLVAVKQSWQVNGEANREEKIDMPGPFYRVDRAVTDQIDVGKGTVRIVTAYNVGDSKQTHSKPCIGAGGDNLCSLVMKGVKICAANFVPLRSKLHVDKIGECIVLDRMNARFGNRVDLAMQKDQHHRAVKFGVQRLDVIEK